MDYQLLTVLNWREKSRPGLDKIEKAVDSALPSGKKLARQIKLYFSEPIHPAWLRCSSVK
jgi:hypothetical protein